MIGIRLADGKIFSICGDGLGKKRVVLSPANISQKKAKIDLFHFSDSGFADAYHLGSLFLDSVDSEIELSIDTDGKRVIAEAVSHATGARDSFTTLLAKPLEQSVEPIFTAPDAVEVKGIRSLQVMVGMVLAILVFLTGFLLYTMIPAEHPCEVAAEPPLLELAPTPVAEPEQEPQEYIRYRVKYGDTLWSIAKDFCRDPYMYRRIADENHLESPEKLISGTVLIIPVEKH